MIDPTLHRAPRGRDVVREQIRMVGLSLRPAALILAALLAIVTTLMIIDLVRGNAETWFDAAEWEPLAFVAFLLPFAVWRFDRPFGPSFFWTLPVDRTRLALARALAGWVWLIAAFVTLIVWQRVLAALSGVADPETIPLIALPAVTATYLLGSAVVLGLRHPLRWLFGAGGLMVLLGLASNELERTRGVDTLLGSRRLFETIADTRSLWETSPDPAQWAIPIVLAVGAGLAALFAAVSRHRERRRR